MKAGDGVFIPRGVVHRNQNPGTAPSRSVEVLIIDKGKPFVEQAPD